MERNIRQSKSFISENHSINSNRLKNSEELENLNYNPQDLKDEANLAWLETCPQY